MPTIESRIAPDGAVTYRAKVRIKGAPQVSASFARKTDAAKWAHATEVAIRENRYFKSPAARRYTLSDAIDRYVREVLLRKPRTAKFQAASLRGGAPNLAICSWSTSPPVPFPRPGQDCWTSQGRVSARAAQPPPTGIWQYCRTCSASRCANGSGSRSTRRRGCASSRNPAVVIAFSPRTIARGSWRPVGRRRIRICTTLLCSRYRRECGVMRFSRCVSTNWI